MNNEMATLTNGGGKQIPIEEVIFIWTTALVLGMMAMIVMFGAGLSGLE